MSIEDINDQMGHSCIAELEQAFLLEEDLERPYRRNPRNDVVRGATGKP